MRYRFAVFLLTGMGCTAVADAPLDLSEVHASQLRIVAHGIALYAGSLPISADTLVVLDAKTDFHLTWWAGDSTVRREGRTGDGPGELRTPRTLVKLDDSTFAVLERTGRAISRFRNDGRFVDGGRFSTGPFLVTGTLFTGMPGEVWLIEDGAPRSSGPTRKDSVPVWRLKPSSGEVKQWAFAGGGGLSEETSSQARVTISTPLWQGDILVRWNPDSVLIIDPRSGLIRYFRDGVESGRDSLTMLPRREIPGRITDSISKFWHNHPNPIFRTVMFAFPKFYGLFDHAIRGSGDELWLRTRSSPTTTEYTIVNIPGGAPELRITFPADVLLLEIRGDSALGMVEQTEGESLTWYGFLRR